MPATSSCFPWAPRPLLTVGRHPVAGILTEITNDAIHLLDPDTSIDLAANLYFSIACSVILTNAWYLLALPFGP